MFQEQRRLNSNRSPIFADVHAKRYHVAQCAKTTGPLAPGLLVAHAGLAALQPDAGSFSIDPVNCIWIEFEPHRCFEY